MRNNITAIFLVLLLASCGREHVFDFQRLEGRWRAAEREGFWIESWKMNEEGIMIGKGEVVNGSDTSLVETLRIEDIGGVLHYSATVADQNENRPVTFLLARATKDEIRFENPHHDFPQYIHYHMLSNDSMVVELGILPMMPEERKIEIRFGRISD